MTDEEQQEPQQEEEKEVQQGVAVPGQDPKDVETGSVSVGGETQGPSAADVPADKQPQEGEDE